MLVGKDHFQEDFKTFAIQSSRRIQHREIASRYAQVHASYGNYREIPLTGPVRVVQSVGGCICSLV